ncbi:MAG: SBBP repeat-containing protein, partial [Anaerolineales bacterium]|nr:SBBP repeat-containing protein [Anaerolineales bacterium]
MNKTRRFAILVAFAFAVWLGWALTQPTAPSQVQAAEIATVPSFFVPNRGQRAPEVLFEAYGLGGTFAFQTDRVVLTLPHLPTAFDDPEVRWALAHGIEVQPDQAFTSSVLQMQFEGANSQTMLAGTVLLPGVMNYFMGNDPKGWFTRLPTYEEIVYRNLYPGIDVFYQGREGELKSTFVVAPGANPGQIRWHYEGATSLVKDPTTGDLKIALSAGEAAEPVVLLERAPVAWQEIDGEQVLIEAATTLGTENQVGFSLGAYNPAYPLVIDPSYVYQNHIHFGGNGVSVSGYGVAIVANSSYVTGDLYWGTVPGDAFVMKLSSGGIPAYISVFGGSGSETGLGIAVNAQDPGEVLYLTGWTNSEDFPTLSAYQDELNLGEPALCNDLPCADAFMMRVDKSSGQILSSTYLGGIADDRGVGIAVNSVGRPTLTGYTNSAEFPTFLPYQAQLGGSMDAFLTKFNSLGNDLVYSTYLGGNETGEIGYAVALNAFGAPYITGSVGPDIFIAKLDVNGDILSFYTVLGGSEVDEARGLAVDSDGNAFVTGRTDSMNFPLQAPLMGVCGGGDAFVAKVTSGGGLSFSTYLCGSWEDGGYGLAIDNQDHLYVTGSTRSEDFYTVNPIHEYQGDTDVFLVKLAPGGVAFNYSTYLGSSDPELDEDGFAVALSSENVAHLAGDDSAGKVYVAAVADSYSYTPPPSSTDDPLFTATPVSPTPSGWVPTSTPVPPTSTPTPTMTPTNTPTPEPLPLFQFEILDANGEPVDELLLSAEGWPILNADQLINVANPLRVKITLSNDDPDFGYLSFSVSTTPGGRFFISNLPKRDGQAASCTAYPTGSDYSFTQYDVVCNDALVPGTPVEYLLEIWVQPSTSATLNISASWGGSDGSGNDSGQVQVPWASIHPVVFLHGILGSMPPKNSLITQWPQPEVLFGETWLDPFLWSYSPLIDNLLKMGYELETTLFPVTYDWRDSNQISACYLRDILQNEVPDSGGIINPDGKADIIVHSMGGMVLRAYLEDMGYESVNADGSWGNPCPYNDDVRKAVFIASPHRGFPVTYNPREAMTWVDYLTTENGFPSGGDLLTVLMNHVIWPFLIVKQYAPSPLDPCWGIGIEIGAGGPLVNIACPREVFYFDSHSTQAQNGFFRGVRSLMEMLPDEEVPIAYLLDENGNPYPFPIPPGSPLGRETNPLLDGPDGLNSQTRINTLLNHVPASNIYVIYNNNLETVESYNVESPPPPTNPYCLGGIVNGQCISGYVPSVSFWPNGEPFGDPNREFGGDDLIPWYSTDLKFPGSELIPALPNGNRLAMGANDGGHKLVASRPKTQDAVAAILTGYDTPSNAISNNPFSIHTSYTPPVFLVDNWGAILAFTAFSPVDVMVTDPLGRRVGHDPASGQIFHEIPGAFYSGNDTDMEFLLIPGDLEGDYTVTTTGTGSGPYSVLAYRVGTAGADILGGASGIASPGVQETATVTYAPVIGQVFLEDTSADETLWMAEGGWGEISDEGNAAPPAWASDAITVPVPGQPVALTLITALDLTVARQARLTFNSRSVLSAGGLAVAEFSIDHGDSWQILGSQPVGDRAWERRAFDLTPFTHTGISPLLLRFRIIPNSVDDHWWVDDIRVESLEPSQVSGIPFEDDFEGWWRWTPEGGWIWSETDAHSPEHTWFSNLSGATLSLAGTFTMTQTSYPELVFWQQVATETIGLVEVSQDGQDWTSVYTTTNGTAGWEKVTVDLQPYAGGNLWLRFKNSNGGIWRLDDVALHDAPPLVVHSLPFADDMA